MSDEHYRVLGVSPDASRAEIKAAYKQRVKETHPDLNDDPNAAEEFKRVKEARDALLGSGAAGGAAGAASGGSGAGNSTAGTSRGSGGRSGASSGRSAGRSSSSRGRSETSSTGGDRRRSRGRSTDSSGSDRRQNNDTRTEEPSGERANAYGSGTTGSSGRRSSGSASTGTGTGDRRRENRSETASSSSREQRRSGGSTEGTTGGPGRSRDYVRFRSVIEEPTGERAASYDRVVGETETTTRQTTETESDVSGPPLFLPAFLVILVKQYLYSLPWTLLGLPLTLAYLHGIRGLYFGGLQAGALSLLLGAVGVSLVRVRLGVNFSGTATIPLVYYGLVWVDSPSLLEVAVAFHLVPLFVVTALISEYK